MNGVQGVPDAAALIRKALSEACAKRPFELVALSGGLDSTIIAWHAARGGVGGRVEGIATIAKDFVSPDLAYSQMAARGLGIPLTISSVGTDELLDAITETIRILRNFNDIEIRNSIVAYHAARWAAANGYDALATGDGADELFAGYRFLTEMPADRLSSEIDRVCSTMHFPSHKIGSALGVSIISPFLDDGVAEVARSIDVGLKVREEPAGGAGRGRGAGSGVRYGKWILRKAFEDDIPRSIAWRTKLAMQDGSGTSGLTAMFDAIAYAGGESYAEEIQGIKDRDGVTIRSLESLHYYKIFRRMFGRPDKSRVTGGRPGSGGAGKEAEKRCPYCRCAVADGARFCRMCAAFPI